MTRAWWRRNALAIGAVAVLLPLTGLTISGVEWWQMNQAQPVFATTVAAGDTVEYAGGTWGPAVVRSQAPGPDDDLPADGRLLVVEVPVDPHGKMLGCDVPALRELDGMQRRWQNALGDVDWDYRNPTVCPSDSTAPFTIEVPYLLPDGVSGPLGLDFALADELPGFLRLGVIVP